MIRKYLREFRLAIFFASIPGSLFSQDELGIPRRITTDDGLPSNYITAITKDSEGFMWFGTDEGLCRWDGITARVYKHNDNDTCSLSNDFIEPEALLWDKEYRKLYIGTAEGVSVYDPSTEKFRNYYPGEGGVYATGNRISAIFKDRQGILWIATDKGFVAWERELDAFKNYYYQGGFKSWHLIDTIKVNTILAISQDIWNDSVLWIGTRSGLLKFNIFTEVIQHFYYDYSPKNIEYAINIFRSVCPHPDGNLYLGTWTEGMTIFSTETEQFTNNLSLRNNSGKSSDNQGTIPPIKIKSDHEIWVPTVFGLIVYDTEAKRITYTKYFKNPAGRIFPMWLSFIEEDERYWCGSRYGVYLFNKRNQQIQNYFFQPGNKFKSYITWDILEDTSAGRIYMAVQDGDGLHFYDTAKHRFDFLRVPVESTHEININSLYQSSDGTIWIICGAGIFKLSSDKRSLVPFITGSEDDSWLQNMVEDKSGNLWVSSSINGIQRVNLEFQRLEDIRNWRKYFEPARNVPDIHEMLIDRDNRIWFLRFYGGYGYYDINNDSVAYFSRAPEADTVFYNLTSFTDGIEGFLWVGDWYCGLGCIDLNNPDLGAQPGYSVENGLYGNTVYKVQTDNRGRLCMMTRYGLELLDPATGENYLFNENDGIVIYDTLSNRKSYLPGTFEKLSDGRMVIGYRRGLGFFDPAKLIRNMEIPVPYLTSLRIFEQEYLNDSSLASLNQFDLKHNQNFLTLEYSAIALTAGKEAVFYHQLEGVDRNWVQSSRRFASYSNLAPGQYLFKVKVKTGYNLWSEDDLELSILISPPWWETWWAYTFYLIVISGTLLGLYRFQLNRQLIRREAERLRELDEIKSRLYTNITHEFRTPLTVITGMTDEVRTVLKPGENKRMEKYLSMIKRNAGNLLHLVNQMLDLSKIEGGMLKLKPIQSDIIPYLQYITESFQSFAESKGVKLTFYNEKAEIVMDYDPDKLFTIISNLLSNAIKYTDKGGKVICHVNAAGMDQKELVIKISDTGVGIPADKLPKIFDRFYQVDGASTRKAEGTGIGLSLVRELIELMSGNIEVKSEPGKGCEFTIRIPVTQRATKQISKVETYFDKTETVDKKVSILPDTTENELSGLGQDEATEYPLTLIVEDNQDVANYISLCLDNDYRIELAANGQVGIDKAVELIPDIIISDVMMPEKDGYEVCSHLKNDERTSHIPIILLTAKAGRDDRIAGLECGADAYLSKPFDKKELMIRMDKMIELRRNIIGKFSHAKDSLKTSLTLENKEDLFLHKAIQSIENNIDNSDFGTLQLARLSGMSESQLYRKLKALTGRSTAIFIRSVRLQKAKELLKTTALNVSEVAYETGFNDPAWFSRVFKEEFGGSPASFREEEEIND